MKVQIIRIHELILAVLVLGLAICLVVHLSSLHAQVGAPATFNVPYYLHIPHYLSHGLFPGNDCANI